MIHFRVSAVLLIFISLFLGGCTGFESRDDSTTPLKTVCLGKSNAKNKAVYLHGFTKEDFSGKEGKNISELRKLVDFLDVQVAVPVSPITCNHLGRKKQCWGLEMTRSRATQALHIASNAAEECFGGRSNFGVIGFSNGGYVATKFFSYCLAQSVQPQLDWIVTVGSAKMWGGQNMNEGNLRYCKPITFVVGKRDHNNYDRRQYYFRRLRAKGAQISIVTFDGGHEVQMGPLSAAVRKIVNK